MSLFDDYEADAQFERDFPYGVPCDTWKSKQGEIKVTNMTEMHIRNCMKMVGEDDAWFAAFEKELERRKHETINTCACNDIARPMTNADYIRSMTDEDLAKFIDSRYGKYACDYCPNGETIKRELCNGQLCKGKTKADIIAKWLKQPYKENTDG